MQSFIWKALIGAAFTGGLLAVGAGVAYADTNTSGDDGTGSGSQAVIGANLPITLGGNAISVLGDSTSSGSSATPPASGPAPTGNTNGNVSLLGGTQALVDAHAPVTVSGNAISVIGDSGSAGSSVGSGSPAGVTGSASSGGSGTTSGDHSTLGGTQVLGDVSAPVNVTGNAISVAGDSSSTGSMAGQSATGSGSTDPASTGGATTSGDSSILGGTQVVPDVAAPVTATGDAVSVIGDSSSTGSSTGESSTGTGSVDGVDTGIPGVTTSGVDGTASGTQIAPVVSAPITIGGDAVSVIGDSSTTSGTPGSGGGGTVGGVDTFPPTTTTAALSVQSLAETGVPALSALLLGILLLMAGIGVMLRAVTLRRS
jgi:hypothetical protein